MLALLQYKIDFSSVSILFTIEQMTVKLIAPTPKGSQHQERYTPHFTVICAMVKHKYSIYIIQVKDRLLFRKYTFHHRTNDCETYRPYPEGLPTSGTVHASFHSHLRYGETQVSNIHYTKGFAKQNSA